MFLFFSSLSKWRIDTYRLNIVAYYRLKDIVRDYQLHRYANPCGLYVYTLAELSTSFAESISPGLSDVLDFPTQEEKRGDSQDEKYQKQGKDVKREVRVQHVQFFQRRFRILEVAIHLENAQRTRSCVNGMQLSRVLTES